MVACTSSPKHSSGLAEAESLLEHRRSGTLQAIQQDEKRGERQGQEKEKEDGREDQINIFLLKVLYRFYF